MAKKSALFGGRTVKVENRSGFDKSFLNMLTTGVGTITPIVRQLVIPSSGKMKVPFHVELPPLAADAYLRTHLKMEAYFCPLRVCYAGFSSWFSGEPVWDSESGSAGELVRATLPFGIIVSDIQEQGQTDRIDVEQNDINAKFGPASLSDYFDLRFALRNDSDHSTLIPVSEQFQIASGEMRGIRVNLFPYLCYHLIYDHFYRNKSVSKPGFAPQAFSRVGSDTKKDNAGHLPFNSCGDWIHGVILGSDSLLDDGSGDSIIDWISVSELDTYSGDGLLNGHHLCELRQRNYGDDYFTAAKPQAQAGNPVQVSVTDGKFTIASLRLSNAMQEFAEVNNYATPDYIQTLSARYGATISDGLAQKPVLLASADYPIFTKSVEMNNNSKAEDSADVGNQRNPFAVSGILGAKAGNANGNGVFSFDFSVNEPGYIMVMATLVPEANYATGLSKEMTIFTSGHSSLVDLPCGLLEHVGDEPIMSRELDSSQASDSVFGYVQRYLWHKSGNVNQIHGLFRRGLSLQAFAPQRDLDSLDSVQISSDFLEVPTTALDDVAAVRYGISHYGVMIDCSVEMFVSEPLSESALPALVNPASEHGKSVYLRNGGSKLA